MAHKQLLRKKLRQKRRQLSFQQQQQASQHLDKILAQTLIFRRARRIAFYLASDGEIDPHYVLHRALSMQKACYLPVVKNKRQLHFIRYQKGDKLKPNRFGILEPQKRQPLGSSHTLDLVLMPLVGFDRTGARLGMGGGFYDYSFRWMANRQQTKTALIGLAHQCQEVGQLSCEPWDIPLSAIATDKEFIVV